MSSLISSRGLALRISALALAISLAACGGGGGEPQQMPPQGVSVAAVVQQSISPSREFTGRVQAVDAVELRPRVAGYLANVHVREGALVAKDALLFSIDDREYRAAVAAAQADVARAEARRKLARTEYERSEALIASRAVSQGDLDARGVELAQAEADVDAANARLLTAQLNLEFTRIKAPIAGRIGAALVKPGNLVAPGDTLLSTLVSVDPVHVVFEADERTFLRYHASATQALSDDAAVPVQVALADEAEFKHAGNLDFLDNQLNAATGTVMARAVLSNPDARLVPGLFARVRLQAEGSATALLIHDQAVLTDQDRKYVFVLGEGNAAQRRDVVLGAQINGLRVVESGLQPSDQVIVNGTRKIFFPDQVVAPVTVPMDAPNSAAAQAAAAAPEA
ncbi:MAG: efflux RND transporter periplasmic adaptor subunit [Lysobacteraceae bacterium]